MRRPFSAKCSNPSPWLAVILDGGGLELGMGKAAWTDPRGRVGRECISPQSIESMKLTLKWRERRCTGYVRGWVILLTKERLSAGDGTTGVVCVCFLAQPCPTFCDRTDCSLSGSSIHGSFQARILSGLPFPSPGDLPSPGIKSVSLTSPALAGGFFSAEPPGWPHNFSLACHLR